MRLCDFRWDPSWRRSPKLRPPPGQGLPLVVEGRAAVVAFRETCERGDLLHRLFVRHRWTAKHDLARFDVLHNPAWAPMITLSAMLM